MRIPFSSSYSAYSWSLLNSEAKQIVHAVQSEWKRLIKRKEKEEIYHQFLANNAGFLLMRIPWLESIVISKLRLGADFVVDFIKTHDYHSGGVQIEFIEIETIQLRDKIVDRKSNFKEIYL